LGHEKGYRERRKTQYTFRRHQLPQRKRKRGWNATQTNFTTGVRDSLHTNKFLTLIQSEAHTRKDLMGGASLDDVKSATLDHIIIWIFPNDDTAEMPAP